MFIIYMKKLFFGRNEKQVERSKGFTLIEILVVIGIIAILAAIVIVAINPSRQFAQARNTQRQSNVEAILNAIGQRMADNQGLFIGTATTTAGCTSANDITTTAQDIASSGGVDLRGCLVPTYMSELPIDPTVGRALNGSTYDTGYKVVKDATTGRITVSAPEANTASELSQTIALTR